MPFIYSPYKVAVTADELVPFYWKTKKALMQHLYRLKDKEYGTKYLRNGGGKDRCMLVDFDTLRKDIQQQLGDPRKNEHKLADYYEVFPEVIDYYHEFVRPDGSYLLHREIEQYTINACVLIAAMELEQARKIYRENRKASTRGVLKSIREDVLSFNSYLEKPHNLPKTEKHFNAIYKSFKDRSYITLIKDAKGSKNNNGRKVTKNLEDIFNSLYANRSFKPTARDVYRDYEKFLNGNAEIYDQNTGELFEPKDFPKIDERTIYGYLKKWENDIITSKKRSGDRQRFNSTHLPYGQMELPKHSGSVLSIDDRNPPFKYRCAKTGKPKRIWFYLGLDIASGCFTTFVFGKSKSGIIKDFYRQMVKDYSNYELPLPYELECESSLNSSFKNTFLREGYMFQKVNILANHAAGKYIEREFGNLRYGSEKRNLEGWFARPNARSESNQKGAKEEKIYEYDDLVFELIKIIEDWNNTAHRDSKETTKWEYFLNNQHPKLTPTNYKSIIPLLGESTKTSCNRGFVSLQNKKRALGLDDNILIGDKLIEMFKKIEHKNIIVYWLANNDGSILKAYAYIKDRFICEIIDFPKYNRADLERTSQCLINKKIQDDYIQTIHQYLRENKVQDNIKFKDNTPAPLRKYKSPFIEDIQTIEEEFGEVIEEDKKEDSYKPDPEETAQNWISKFVN